MKFGFNTPFAEQIEFFRQKLNLPTEHWDDIMRETHDRAFVVAGAMKADLLDDAGRPRLELHRRVGPGDRVARDLADHVAAAQEGAHLGLPLTPDIDPARSRRPVKLVPGDRVEIAADGLHVDRHVDGGL